jgi:large conductance mechanosensitive channel
VIGYGAFITTIINFLIIALVMFLIVRTANRLAREKVEAPAPPEPTAEEKLLTEIRDLLKQRTAV